MFVSIDYRRRHTQTERETERHIETHTDRERDTERHREKTTEINHKPDLDS